MLFTVLAPEVILALDVESFFDARERRKKLIRGGNYRWTLRHMQFANNRGFRKRIPGQEPTECTPVELCDLIESNRVGDPPVSDEELCSRGKNDAFVTVLAILQIIWFAIQTLFRAIQGYHTTVFEIMTVAFVFCSLAIYGFNWTTPQNVEYPIVLNIEDTAQTQSRKVSRPSVNPLIGNSSWAVEWAFITVLGLFGCGFGAIHFLAWNSTSNERLAWRICASSTTALPALFCLCISLATRSKLRKDFKAIIINSVSGLYIIGRIVIVVLALMSFRALPADAFETVNWQNYFPHFAA